MSVIYRFTDNTIIYHHIIDKQPRAEDFFMHVHDMCEIFYFISGSAHYIVEGSIYPLEPGSLMLMRPGETHKLQLQTDSPYERIAVHFSPEIIRIIDPRDNLLQPFFDHPLGQQNLYQRASVRGGFIHECLSGMETDSADDYYRRLAVMAHLYPLLAEIRSAFLLQKQEIMPSPHQDISRELVEYINYNLNSELSLELLSEQFFISKCQLNRVFKQATGSSIWDYILIKRLINARKLLREGKPALEVCQACGFRDYSSFYRNYKKRFQVSPGEDRP